MFEIKRGEIGPVGQDQKRIRAGSGFVGVARIVDVAVEDLFGLSHSGGIVGDD